MYFSPISKPPIIENILVGDGLGMPEEHGLLDHRVFNQKEESDFLRLLFLPFDITQGRLFSKT